MSTGLVGSHRTGKSTLAEAVSNETDLPLVLTNLSKVFEDNGIRPDENMHFGERIAIQEKLLSASSEAWSKERNFITDRTPIDFLAYTLCDIRGDTIMSDLDHRRLKTYVDNCYEALNRYFSVLVLVQPGIPIVPAPGKASLNPAYMEHLNATAMGLMMNERVSACCTYIRRERLDLQERVKSVLVAQKSCVSRHQEGFTVKH